MKSLRLAAIVICALIAACSRTGTPETETTGSVQSEQQTTGATATTTGSTGGTIANLPEKDKEFVTTVGMMGLAEVQYAQLALAKASDSRVQEFAQRMVDDHTKSNEELQQLATAKGLALPTELDGDHQAALEKLRSLEGSQFDRVYMDQMIADHEKAATFLGEASAGLMDEDLRTYAAKTLTTIQDHQRLANGINTKVE